MTEGKRRVKKIGLESLVELIKRYNKSLITVSPKRNVLGLGLRVDWSLARLLYLTDSRDLQHVWQLSRLSKSVLSWYSARYNLSHCHKVKETQLYIMIQNDSLNSNLHNNLLPLFLLGPQGSTGPQGQFGRPGQPGATGNTGSTGQSGSNGEQDW